MYDHIEVSFFDNFPGVLATIKAPEENEQVKAYREASKKGRKAKDPRAEEQDTLDYDST